MTIQKYVQTQTIEAMQFESPEESWDELVAWADFRATRETKLAGDAISSDEVFMLVDDNVIQLLQQKQWVYRDITSGRFYVLTDKEFGEQYMKESKRS